MTDPRHDHRRLLILGANGPTGRLVVEQALARGYRVDALTRHPDAFPLEHERLTVITGDATDPAAIDAAVASTDAVICSIGTSFTRHPVTVYSASVKLVVAAMQRHGHRRLIVVTSSGVSKQRAGRSLLSTLSYRLMRNVVGRTVYDDMAKMEALVAASDLDWTIVHPPGLTDEPGTGYAVAENAIEGAFSAREDLATMLLDQLDAQTYVRKVAAVTTPGLRVSGMQMLRREVLKQK